ncbi:hypothetical protein NFI96_002136 [Prochilodus magdalenae]|nr:hypothetical protein NFI96_002136 [Prochilodus magdalenae]
MEDTTAHWMSVVVAVGSVSCLRSYTFDDVYQEREELGLSRVNTTRTPVELYQKLVQFMPDPIQLLLVLAEEVSVTVGLILCPVDKSPEGQFTQLMALPRTLQQQITRLVDPPGKNRDVEEILLQVAQDPDCGFVVQQGIYSIVKSSSITQSAKGVITAVLSLYLTDPTATITDLQRAVVSSMSPPVSAAPSADGCTTQDYIHTDRYHDCP